MRNAKVAVPALVLLALAGCTGTGSSGPSGSLSSSATSAPTATSQPSTTLSPSGPAQSRPTEVPPPASAEPLPGGSTEVPDQQVDGTTLPDTYKRDAWASADGRTVRVVGLAGGCKTASAEVAAQSADQVQITLVTTYTPPAGGGVCAQELRDVPLNVVLDAPLGDRRIVLEAREQTG
ncbi:hypothetical protein [Saccharothrix sp. Mg75]|uniref:hypothetical protein n=1 Tax=Saccharothrix sp. Mg75 TaxID=3445357 RepID=UPI003EEAC95B